MPTAMTRSGMRTEVLARLGETAGFFTTSDLNQWLQDGVDDLTQKLEPLIRSVTIDVVAASGQSALLKGRYPVPTDILSIKRALYGGTGAWANLQETNYEALFEADPDWEDDTTATPSHWYWYGDTVGLYPPPSTALTAGFRLVYTYRPADMATDSSPSGLQAFLDRGVLLWALWRCYLKDKDERRGAMALKEYQAVVNDAGRLLNKHRKGHAPQLVPNTRPYRGYYQDRRRGRLVLTD